MDKVVKMKKKNKIKIIILGLLAFLFLAIIGFIISFSYFTSPVSKTSKEINIIIDSGETIYDIANKLKEADLIKNETVFIYYTKLKKANNIYAASYYFNQNQNLDQIIETLLEGGHNENEIRVTFNEGINMRKIASIIEENTNNSYKDVMNKLKDEKYINSLIEEYWFLTKDIKNKKIYYPLEGYLFPNTYFFSSKDVTVEEIFKTMLDEMERKLEPYKEKIEKNKYSIHKLITLASITQSEGYNEDDFKNIASVFYNRLEDNTPLGSCVTSYYGVKKEMTEELLITDINASNAYNTRGDNPSLISVGPISNPGSKALDAVFNPIKTDYYFFVSDKNHKLYFTKTNSEHERKISELMNEGLWYEW